MTEQNDRNSLATKKMKPLLIELRLILFALGILNIEPVLKL